ncbi:MAG TPA: hypothetical protein DDX92_11255 [Flavobacteriales bacterium]|nr:hypothetical protein [Flavobacteriales bacterium]
MQRKFITNLGLLLLLNLLIKPFWVLGIGVSVQKAVGPETYGVYFAMLNFSFLFQLLLDFGINNFQNRNVARKEDMVSKYFLTLAILKLVLGVVFLTTVFSVGKYIMKYSDYYLYLLLLVGINQVLMSFLLYLRANIAGLHLFVVDSILSVLDRLIMIILCGLLLWGGITNQKFQIEWFAYAQGLAYLVSALLALTVIISHSGLVKININSADLKFIFRSSFPHAMLALIMTIYFKIDAVMIEHLLPNGAQESGIYAQAYRLLEMAVMFAFLFANLLYPIFSRMLANGERINELLTLASKLLLAPAIIFTTGVAYYSFDLMDFLFDEKVAETASVLPILIATFVPMAASYIFGTLLTANGSLRYLNIVAFNAMILNLLMNYFLIPVLGIEGAAWATLATSILVVFLQVSATWLQFKLKYGVYVFLRFTAFVIGTGVLVIMSEYVGKGIISFLVFNILGLGFAMLLRILDLRQLSALVKRGE